MPVNKQLIDQHRNANPKTYIDRWVVHLTNLLGEEEIRELITALQGVLVKDDNSTT